ncbi:Protein C02C2.4 [Aphelenchoides avenae]|nr:Protein C02C2.4 [Aphelenchus avenae]
MTKGSVDRMPLYHFKSMRLYVSFIMMFAIYCMMTMRSNLGIAMVCMVNATAYSAPLSTHGTSAMQNTTELPACQQRDVGSGTLKGYDGTLLWSPSMQANLFSAMFYGSLVTIGISGTIADKFHPKWLTFFAIASNTILSFLTPSLAMWNYYAYLVGRFLMGVAEGFIFPCTSSIIARWFPPDERSTAAAMYTSGSQLASTVGVLISTELCMVSLFGGWPSIFYLCGFLGVIFLVLWAVFVTDSPNQNKFITDREKIYLNVELSSLHGGLASKKNGFFTAMPFLTQLIFKTGFAVIADALKRANVLSTTAACKVLQGLAAFGTSLSLIGLALWVDCSTPTLALVLLAFFGMCFAGAISGAFTAALCIAPPHTGTIASLSSLVGAVGNIAAPTLIGLINKNGTAREWGFIFFAAAGINVISGIFFMIFGSGNGCQQSTNGSFSLLIL